MQLYEQLAPFGEVRLQESMRKHTTYRIGGDADYYIRPHSQKDLQPVLEILNRENVPFLILGKGSNVLMADEPFKGAVINLDKACREFSFDENDVLTAGAGCSLIALSVEAMNRGLTGLEFASGIPGSVGGGLYMNAGAYRSDLAALLKDVLVYRNGQTEWISREELGYTYRHSLFQIHKDWIILAGRFQLEKGQKEEIQELMLSRKRRREESQPTDKPCAGSVFRNPEGCNAWKIVDDLGLRGARQGGAVVSSKHSNFIVNEDGNATARDVNELITRIQKQAMEKYGISLITEVERINWNEKG